MPYEYPNQIGARKLKNWVIQETFARMGTALATHNGFLGRWSANSQYGYALSWHDNETDAIRATLDYYSDKMHLITQ